MKPTIAKLPLKKTSPITEAAKMHPKPKAESHVAPYGVDDPNGHVMKRIKHAKPALLAKIQNWD